MDDQVDIKDLEAFMQGLQVSFDSLEQAQIDDSKGIQAQMAKAISQLREKKVAKIKPMPKLLGHVTKEDLKKFFLNQLEDLKALLESNNFNNNRKFDLVMKITQLREKVNSF
ncbi:MAG: hypothetical protein GF317_18135 [Candidatus Lokiarchaeota archaeon]|nr:hypothetical protein [Candidatus Lokiarchaeota archaeon]MBD3201433.1 hypothetical protein [Candidatus Lokiarchaeota archaeon]